MALDQRFPPFTIERQTVGGDQFVSFLDILHRHPAREILLEEHLQTEKQHILVGPTAPRLGIGRNRRRLWRVLQEVGIFVAVGVENEVHETAFQGNVRGVLQPSCMFRLAS